MKSLRFLPLLAAVAVVPLLAQADLPHRGCCNSCGCSQVKKVCRLVPDVKKVPKVNYTVECEDICLQGPSKKCGVKCVPDCEACGGWRKEIIWEPRCGCVITRKKLKKTTTIEEKPGFKCVVEKICCSCGCAQVDSEATEEAQRYVDALPDSELQKLAEMISVSPEPKATADIAPAMLPVQPASASEPLLKP